MKVSSAIALVLTLLITNLLPAQVSACEHGWQQCQPSGLFKTYKCPAHIKGSCVAYHHGQGKATKCCKPSDHECEHCKKDSKCNKKGNKHQASPKMKCQSGCCQVA
ncbi:hypothetical protein Ddc_12067 [Ditylenchus destructor]|nr:hypothetical protein Ddc_12067 [Ditylenchus destructor]